MKCVALLVWNSYRLPIRTTITYVTTKQNGIGAPGRFDVQEISAASQILKNGRFFALLKTSSGECRTSGRPKGVHQSKEESFIQLSGQSLAWVGAMVQIFQVASRNFCVTGRRRLEKSAGSSGSVDVAVCLSSMAGAIMTIEEATRKPFWGRSKTGKAGPAPRVLDKREGVVRKRLKWHATLGSCLSCWFSRYRSLG